MIAENVVTKKYAHALLANLKTQDIVDEVYNEMNYFLDRLNCNKSIKKILLSKFVPKRIKMIFCGTIFLELNISNVLRNFIKVLIKNKRLHLLERVIASLTRIMNAQNNIETLELTFANKVDEDFLQKIKDGLRRYFQNKNIKFLIHFNKNILGGMLIQNKSQMVDLSLLSKVRKIHSLDSVISYKLMD